MINFCCEIPEWVRRRIPSMNICDRKVQVQGRLCRVARLDADDYKFLDDPEPVLAELRESKLRIDIFTCMQKLPETAPKYAYPMEWDNMADRQVPTLEQKWTKQSRVARPNKRQAAKKRE